VTDASFDTLPKDQSSFLEDPALCAVFDALAHEGETRVVGGAVRNALMGLDVVDVDLATDIEPERVMALAKGGGLKPVPTGIEHGTITIVSLDTPFEVTTLRADVETFGRKAKVEFGKDWRGDALRRDFTMNALYCDRQGLIYDPLGGLDDIKRRKVRFVGKPAQRIQEDYLRILRFFRLHGQYGKGALDRAGLNACIADQDGLAQLARARVRMEMLKLLVSARSGEVLRIMSKAKILQRVLPGARAFATLDRVCELERALELIPNAVLRMAALYDGPVPIEEIEAHLELSRKEQKRLHELEGAAPLPGDIEQAKRSLYRLGLGLYQDIVLLSWAKSRAGVDHDAWKALYDLPDVWPMLEFPLSGADIMDRGVKSGPQVGLVLKSVEDKWIAAGFPEHKSFFTEALDQAIAAL